MANRLFVTVKRIFKCGCHCFILAKQSGENGKEQAKKAEEKKS